MAVYNIKAEQLDSILDISSNALEIAYDVERNVVFEISSGKYHSQIRYLKDWLINKATYNANNDTYVKERYRMDTSAWADGATAMACAQSALAYLHLWKYTNNTQYLTVARNIVTSLEKGRRTDDGFPMFIYWANHTIDANVYIGGNSETPISLFRMALIDTDNAPIYIQSGLKSTDYLLAHQRNDGSWPTTLTNPKDNTSTPMFTAQAVAALAYGYQYTTNKNGYASGIEKGITYIKTQLTQDGRVKTSMELGSSSEYWRPPTSDQAIAIRGIAIAEYLLPNNQNVDQWKTLRKTLLAYLNNCIGAEGSVRNGLGTTTLPNDINGITDHVYTTSWAIEAYYYSGMVDSDASEINKSVGITDFCSGNLYFSSNPNTNGTIRGAYNVRDDNWDTSALVQDEGNEGGADMIYVGWVMSPILTWMIKYNQETIN